MTYNQRNQYNLSRNIPEPIARQIRQECGFGCIVCGYPIYEYDHLDPEFHEANEHNPTAIGLLCPRCHSNKTRGIWSTDKFLEARKNPFARSNRILPLDFDLSASSEYIVKIGRSEFKNISSIIEIDDKTILSIRSPEEDNTPFQISARFFDRSNKLIGVIENNQWYAETTVFDMEIRGPRIVIRSDMGAIDLTLLLEPPNRIVLERLNLSYNYKRISGPRNNVFTLESGITKVDLNDECKKYQNAPFWARIKGEKIYIGTESIIEFTNLAGHTELLPGFYELSIGNYEVSSKVSESLPNETDLLKISSTGTGGIGLNFRIPSEDGSSYFKFGSSQKRNSDCACGSGKKFKKCCLINLKILNNLFRNTRLVDLFQRASNDGTEIFFDFLSNKSSTSFHDSTKRCSIILDSLLEFDEIEIASRLSLIHKITEGFPIVGKHFYKDLRNWIVDELVDTIRQISIREELRLMGFSMENMTIKLFKELDATFSSCKTLQGSTGAIHLGAIKYLQFNYSAFTAEHSKWVLYDNLFEQKAPHSRALAIQLIELINKSNPYTSQGAKIALKECLSLLDNDSPGSYAEILAFLG